MRRIISSIKKKLTKDDEELFDTTEEEYVELDITSSKDQTKILVRPFTLENFEDIKPILESLREGNTIALINISPLKEKDLVDLKRAINRIKKSCDAIDGDIAGFGEDWIAAVPKFATIFRTGKKPQ